VIAIYRGQTLHGLIDPCVRYQYIDHFDETFKRLHQRMDHALRGDICRGTKLDNHFDIALSLCKFYW
jgi:hypothetical protein